MHISLSALPGAASRWLRTTFFSENRQFPMWRESCVDGISRGGVASSGVEMADTGCDDGATQSLFVESDPRLRPVSGCVFKFCQKWPDFLDFLIDLRFDTFLGCCVSAARPELGSRKRIRAARLTRDLFAVSLNDC